MSGSEKAFAAAAIHRSLLVPDSPDTILWVEPDGRPAGLNDGAKFEDCPDTHIGIVRIGRPGEELKTYVTRAGVSGRISDDDIMHPIARIFDPSQGGPLLAKTVERLDRSLADRIDR